MKVFLLVITGFEESFREIDDMRREMCKKHNIPVLFLYNKNGPPGFKLREDERLLPVDQHIPGQFIKFHLALREVFEKHGGDEYDYIIRCTSSTLIDFEKLPVLLNYLPKQRCHAGRFLWNDYGVYMSGPCMVFSKDVAKKFAEKETYHERVFEHSDDVMISQAVGNSADFFDIRFFWLEYDGKTEHPTKQSLEERKPWHVVYRIKNNFTHPEKPEFTKEEGGQIDVEYWKLVREHIQG